MKQLMLMLVALMVGSVTFADRIGENLAHFSEVCVIVTVRDSDTNTYNQSLEDRILARIRDRAFLYNIPLSTSCSGNVYGIFLSASVYYMGGGSNNVVYRHTLDGWKEQVANFRYVSLWDVGGVGIIELGRIESQFEEIVLKMFDDFSVDWKSSRR